MSLKGFIFTGVTRKLIIDKMTDKISCVISSEITIIMKSVMIYVMTVLITNV